MQLKKPLSLLFVTCFMISACSETLFVPPTSTSTATLTDTSVPTRTVSPTVTPVLIDTFAPPTLAPTLEIRTGTPVAEWGGIPIMPNALIGKARGNYYLYTTKASQEEVKDYYVRTLQNQGWKYTDDSRTVSQEDKFIIVSFPTNEGGYLIEIVEIGLLQAGTMSIYEADGFTYVFISLNYIISTPSKPA